MHNDKNIIGLPVEINGQQFVIASEYTNTVTGCDGCYFFTSKHGCNLTTVTHKKNFDIRENIQQQIFDVIKINVGICTPGFGIFIPTFLIETQINF